MKEALIRTESVIGSNALEKLKASRVAVFGLGGVGGNCVEALARSGIGTLDLIDNDEVVCSNLNRQVFATQQTIGMKKTDAAKQRVLDISPDTTVNLYPFFYLPDRKDEIPFEQFDYIVDAVDTVAAKLELVTRCDALGKPIICAMGPGDFTSSGHYIVLVGVEDGLLRVNDPNSRENSGKLWKFEDIESQFRNLWVIRNL